MSWSTEKPGFDIRRRRNIASLYRKLALKSTLKSEWTDYSVSEDSVCVLSVPSFGVFINSRIVNEIFVWFKQAKLCCGFFLFVFRNPVISAWFLYMSGVILLTSSQAGLMVSSLRQVLKYVLLVGRRNPAGCSHDRTKYFNLKSALYFIYSNFHFSVSCELSTAH